MLRIYLGDFYPDVLGWFRVTMVSGSINKGRFLRGLSQQSSFS